MSFNSAGNWLQILPYIKLFSVPRNSLQNVQVSLTVYTYLNSQVTASITFADSSLFIVLTHFIQLASEICGDYVIREMLLSATQTDVTVNNMIREMLLLTTQSERCYCQQNDLRDFTVNSMIRDVTVISMIREMLLSTAWSEVLLLSTT